MTLPRSHPLAETAVHKTAAKGLALFSALVALLLGMPNNVQAEKADRQQPLIIEADQSSTVDFSRRVVVFNGRVVLTQGTLRILADRVEVADMGDGHRSAQARGRPDQPAQFREKRDGVEEFVEGRANLIEYDSREALIRLSGKAVVRRLRGTQLADEVQGETIVWNGSRESFSVAPAERGGADGRGERVRGVFNPLPAAAAASGNAAPTPAPSAPSPTRR
jgi:lipopolysaccharide export system protein LptA